MRPILRCFLLLFPVIGFVGATAAQAKQAYTYSFHIENNAFFNIRWRPTVIFPKSTVGHDWSGTMHIGNKSHLNYPAYFKYWEIDMKIDVEYNNGTSWNHLCTETVSRADYMLVQVTGGLISGRKCTTYGRLTEQYGTYPPPIASPWPW